MKQQGVKKKLFFAKLKRNSLTRNIANYRKEKSYIKKIMIRHDILKKMDGLLFEEEFMNANKKRK